jgi:D-glycero-D-manno-heptose 1,7-bisphosphate phosphatase
MAKHPAIFLDRDGTMIDDAGYIEKASEVKFYSFTFLHKSEDNCAYKTPKSYFIEKARQLYNINLSQSFIIGDHPSDVQCGINAGITPIYVLTGHGDKHKNEIKKETIICNNILEATKYLTSIND